MFSGLCFLKKVLGNFLAGIGAIMENFFVPIILSYCSHNILLYHGFYRTKKAIQASNGRLGFGALRYFRKASL